jgi:hypothetical protein
MTLSNLPKNSAHAHVLSSRSHFTLRRAYILELIRSILRESSGIVTYIKQLKHAFSRLLRTCFDSLYYFVPPLVFSSCFRPYSLFTSPVFCCFFFFSSFSSHFMSVPCSYHFSACVCLGSLCFCAHCVGFNTGIHLLKVMICKRLSVKETLHHADTGNSLCVNDPYIHIC